MENREIKFKCWNGTKMLEGWEFHVSGEGMPYECWADNGAGGDSEPLPNNILMQYTGLKDAHINGEEIYDCDIIENCDTKELQVVYWNEDKAAWYCRYVCDYKRIVSLSDSIGNLNKKVGNIYETPELLTNNQNK